MPRSSMCFSMNWLAAREGPPTPVWKEKPSLKYGVAAMTSATASAIFSSRGSWETRASLEPILAGSPILVHDDDGVDVDLGDGGRLVRVIDQRVGDHHDFVGPAGVADRIAEGAAVRLSARTGGVAALVGGGGGEEGDIDVHLAGLDGARAAAVRADNRRGLELTGGNDLADAAADAGGLDADDLTLLNVVRHVVMGVAERGGGDGDVLEAHVLDEDLHHGRSGLVTVAEVVMEGDGHAVMGAAALARLADGRAQLAVLRGLASARLGSGLLHIGAIEVVLALVDFLAVCQRLLRDIPAYCVNQLYSLLLTDRRGRRPKPWPA